MTFSGNPVFALIAACCRWPADEQRAAAVRQSAALVPQWDEVVRLADRHRVEPLVTNGLVAAGVQVPPALQSAVQHHRALGLRDIAQTLKIATALDDAGIEHRFLKGAALGIAAYGSPLLKRSWDIDLLVMPDQAVAAADVLGALDFRSLMPPRPFDRNEYERWSVVSKEAEFRSPSGTTVELHWRLSDHPQLLPGMDAASPKRLVPLLGDHGVATLADDANLAYLAVHGTAHAWFRLKWIADFNALLCTVPADEREGVIKRARGLGVGNALEAGVDLARLLFSDVVRVEPSRLVALSLRALEENEEGVKRFADEARMRLDPSLRYRVRELLQRLRGSEDRLRFPLSRRLRFLYPLLRVPMWVSRRVTARRRD